MLLWEKLEAWDAGMVK